MSLFTKDYRNHEIAVRQPEQADLWQAIVVDSSGAISTTTLFPTQVLLWLKQADGG